jgi:hypothetical protein
VQLHRKAVQVADVQRAKVAVESVIQQGLVNAEVDRRERLGASSSRPCRRTRGALRRRRMLLRVRERGVRIWCVCIRGEIKSVLDVLEGYRLSIRPGALCFGLCYGC